MARRIITPPEERFLKYVSPCPNTGCWFWLAAIDAKGYGRFSLNSKQTSAHEAAYRLFVGPVPDGLELDHLCRNTECSNPQHLEPVTHAENMRRGKIWKRWTEASKARAHCKYGHPYSEENTIYRQSKRDAPYRDCRICRRAQWTKQNKIKSFKRQPTARITENPALPGAALPSAH